MRCPFSLWPLFTGPCSRSDCCSTLTRSALRRRFRFPARHVAELRGGVLRERARRSEEVPAGARARGRGLPRGQDRFSGFLEPAGRQAANRRRVPGTKAFKGPLQHLAWHPKGFSMAPMICVSSSYHAFWITWPGTGCSATESAYASF